MCVCVCTYIFFYGYRYLRMYMYPYNVSSLKVSHLCNILCVMIYKLSHLSYNKGIHNVMKNSAFRICNKYWAAIVHYDIFRLLQLNYS